MLKNITLKNLVYYRYECSKNFWYIVDVSDFKKFYYVVDMSDFKNF